MPALEKRTGLFPYSAAQLPQEIRKKNTSLEDKFTSAAATKLCKTTPPFSMDAITISPVAHKRNYPEDTFREEYPKDNVKNAQTASRPSVHVDEWYFGNGNGVFF
jgi:hypothetical protein